MLGFLKGFWGSIAALIALMLVLEHAGGFSRVLGSGSNLVTGTVKAFKA